MTSVTEVNPQVSQLVVVILKGAAFKCYKLNNRSTFIKLFYFKM